MSDRGLEILFELAIAHEWMRPLLEEIEKLDPISVEGFILKQTLGELRAAVEESKVFVQVRDRLHPENKDQVD